MGSAFDRNYGDLDDLRILEDVLRGSIAVARVALEESCHNFSGDETVDELAQRLADLRRLLTEVVEAIEKRES